MKLLTCFLSLTLCIASLTAQTTFGLHAGMNYGTVHRDRDLQVKEKYNPGYFMGATARYKGKSHFALGLDVQFSVKNSRLGLVGLPDAADTRFQNFNLEMAPRAEYFFTKHLGISMGIYSAWLLAQRTKIAGSDAWHETERNFYSSGWDAGLSPGIALQFGRVFGFLRYTHGVVAVDRLELTDDQGADAGICKLFNRYFQVGVGYGVYE